MNELRDLLLANLDAAFDKHGWHGPTLRGSLRGVTAEQAIWRPGEGRHSVWELALHAAYWKYIARRRLLGIRGGERFPWKGSNWFASPSAAGADEWRAVIAFLDDQHRQLRAAIESIRDKQLRNPKTARLIYGIAAHDLYHTGQISLVKRLRSPR